MTKSFSLALLSFVVFGCATVSECPQIPTATVPETKLTGAQSESVSLHASTKPETETEKAKVRGLNQPSSNTLGAQEIRRVQALLKTAGFNPGPIDGAFGPKTKNALLGLRSGCTDLSDLTQGSVLERMAPSIKSLTDDHGGGAKTTQRKEEIRVIQLRLKHAGFDPGAIDGVAGPKTQAAVVRLRSGCGALETMPPAVFEMAASVEKGNLSTSTAVGHGTVADAVPSAAVAHSKSSRLSGTATDDSGALVMHLRGNPSKDLGASPVSLGEHRGEQRESARRPRDEKGANPVSPTRPSSAMRMTEY